MNVRESEIVMFFGNKKDPFKNIEDFFTEDFFGAFPAFRRSLEPAMDIYQTDKNVVVELQVPNVDPKNIDIEVENDVLTVSGREDEEKEEKNKNYLKKEIRRGSFRRSIRLPVSVKSSQAQADFRKGMLKITLPKTEESRGRKIEINPWEE